LSTLDQGLGLLKDEQVKLQLMRPRDALVDNSQLILIQ